MDEGRARETETAMSECYSDEMNKESSGNRIAAKQKHKKHKTGMQNISAKLKQNGDAKQKECQAGGLKIG